MYQTRNFAHAYVSSRQESNPHYKLRKLASYPLNDGRLFGPPRIGLGLQDPQPCVLPLYYGPFLYGDVLSRAAGLGSSICARSKRRSTTVRVGVAHVSSRKRCVTRTGLTRFAAADVSHTSGGILFSGCRESNPVYTHPKRAYYRYTTARKKNSSPRVCTTGILRPDSKHHRAPIVTNKVAVVTNILSSTLENFATPPRGRTSSCDIAPVCTARRNIPQGIFLRLCAPYRIRTYDLSNVNRTL